MLFWPFQLECPRVRQQEQGILHAAVATILGGLVHLIEDDARIGHACHDQTFHDGPEFGIAKDMVSAGQG
ncbi:hypothetical protein D3W54_13475 [Komagataeibacter medellinensis]|uniref:Uncharacterized protein n=1 Tax=Komagataeibacter medellinensis TaxID=1177712 RepID=A0ABQ6W0V1_9PROT|nr:hypothetical protein [Komagataeibacter medellinensis]KAB8125038.1 hypothetical protein D3W54_13475 [Komagataeibacter medellinensis]